LNLRPPRPERGLTPEDSWIQRFLSRSRAFVRVRFGRSCGRRLERVRL